MILWLGLLLCLTLWGASFRRDGIAAYYISRDGTNAVRGVFILLILGMHFTQYVSASADPAVTAFWAVRRFFDQLAVCMFLFYSGYGVALSFAEKGEGYRKSFLQKRRPWKRGQRLWRRRRLPPPGISEMKGRSMNRS